MHILISGATGFIGKTLTKKLVSLGHQVTVLSRNAQKAEKIFDKNVHTLKRQSIQKDSLSGIDCVIHLAGASINTLPWSKKNKDIIYNSRIDTTKRLVEILPSSCHTFICGSAIGYYPSSLDKEYDIGYTNNHPHSFMEKLCVDWEKQAVKASSSTTRVVTLRTGLVMGDEKLGKILDLSTKFFGGIILGTGNQWMPIINLDQWIDNCIAIIDNKSISGPINMVSKNIKHEDYIRHLAKKLHRPVWLHVPEKLLKILLGEASQLILGSWKIKPTILLDRYK